MDPDQRAAFMQAILADPEADGPRLIFADRLEEEGDPLGEFVRVQCELARLPAPLEVDWVNGRCSVCGEEETLSSHYHCTVCGDLTSGMGCGKEACRRQQERLAALRRREAELLTDENWLRWAGPALLSASMYDWCNLDGPWDWEFRRGFVEHVTFPCADWLAHGPAVVRAQPVTKVTLSDKRPSRHIAANGQEYRSWGCGLRRNGGSEPAAVLPFDIWLRLPESFVGGGNSVRPVLPAYPGEANALEAASAACLAFARAALPAPAGAR
jgi:uncharacterized protein (TIGR02996 family)